MSECLTDEQLETLAAGALPDAEAAPWRKHVEQCPACQAIFDECRANRFFEDGVKEALRSNGEKSGAKAKFAASSVTDALDARLEAREPGKVPAGSIPGYEIIREIHRGGQGVVYEALQLSTGRNVAVKVLLDGPFAGQRSRWRFEREVRLVAALKHPNIVTLHDSGIAQGKYYFVMDLIQGLTLDAYVRSGNLGVRDIVRLFTQVCDAVSCAHRHGVMHRDIKPSNILVSGDGTPYVLDFGLAKIIGDTVDGNERRASQPDLVSIAGHLMGTLAYMSPEQTAGNPEAIDVRTDVYSLGVVLYEILTGEPPYETVKTDITAAMRNIRDFDPPRLSKIRREINSEIDAIVLKALAKEPERRYQSAGELGQDLTAWLEGRPVTAKSASSLYLLRKIAVRHSVETLGISAIVLAILGVGIIGFDQSRVTQKKNNELETSRKNLERQTTALETLLNNARLTLDQQRFGWFLVEWEGGRLDRAREIRSLTPRTSPEHAAMTFLLDENGSSSLKQLLSELPPSSAALAHFVAGERALNGNQFDEAMRFFDLSVKSPQGDWVKAAARARLEQLRLRQSTAAGRINSEARQ